MLRIKYLTVRQVDMIETTALIAVTLLATLGLGFCLGIMAGCVEIVEEPMSDVEFMEKIGERADE